MATATKKAGMRRVILRDTRLDTFEGPIPKREGERENQTGGLRCLTCTPERFEVERQSQGSNRSAGWKTKDKKRGHHEKKKVSVIATKSR